jgi:thioredoxin-related protein
MNKERIILIAAIVVASLALLFVWHKDKKEEVTVPLWTPQAQSLPAINANKAATEQKKRTIFFFTSSTCPPCERMKREVFPNTDVQKLLNNYVFQTIDVTVDRQTTSKYQVKVTPTLVMIDGDSTVKRQEGAMSVSQMVAWLQGDQNPKTDSDDKKDKPKDATPEKKGLSNLFHHRN